MKNNAARSYTAIRGEVAESIEGIDLASLGRDGLLILQYRLGIDGGWGTWQVPSEFMPDGQLQSRGQRTIELAKILPEGMAIDDPRAESVWLELLRFGVVRSLCVGRKFHVKPSTVCTELKNLAVIVRKALLRPEGEGGLWSILREDDFVESSSIGQTLFRTLENFYYRGLIASTPLPFPKVEGHAPELDRQHEEVPKTPKRESKEWQPLSDTFTSECGWRSLYLIKIVGPTLLDAIEAALSVSSADQEPLARVFDDTESKETVAEWDAIIKGWRWTKPDGKELDKLDFNIHLVHTSYRDKVKTQCLPSAAWPPKSLDDAWKLLTVLQGAHLFPVCLATGPRASEVSSLTDDCLNPEKGGGNIVCGKTFKLSGRIGGLDQEVTVPSVVVQALSQQIRLSKLVKRRGGINGNHLWVHIRTIGNSVMGRKQVLLSQFLNAYAKKIGIHHLLDPENPNLHIHRFRKTLARVVALALVNSPTILMDCFGHEDPEMTIRRYILSDRSIAREILVIQRELVIMMAIEVASNADSLGGLAAEGLRKRKSDFMMLLGKSEFEPQDAYEFARRETFNGRSWMMISPGVYCTLPHGNGGACAKGQGGNNPAYCQSGCQFQLLTEHSKMVVEDAIAEIVINLERAVDDDEPLLISQWAGQLRNWLYRWSDIENKWRSHPLVMQYGVRLEAV